MAKITNRSKVSYLYFSLTFPENISFYRLRTKKCLNLQFMIKSFALYYTSALPLDESHLVGLVGAMLYVPAEQTDLIKYVAKDWIQNLNL